MNSHRRFGGVFCPPLQGISNSRRPEERLVGYRVFAQLDTNIMASRNHKTFALLHSLPQIISVWSTVRTCKSDVTLVPYSAEHFVNSRATTLFSSRSFPEACSSFSYCLVTLQLLFSCCLVTV